MTEKREVILTEKREVILTEEQKIKAFNDGYEELRKKYNLQFIVQPVYRGGWTLTPEITVGKIKEN